ncbi:hypothetical protein DY000_02056715 [Brassica cretica]|uniref:Uncharacterized protein n=1 Tax=Brassica cretica TaxID=69181 RepID=A0ABQ7A4C3_BRACR|nr:hypothetical protein DY000_02056715 [Brassica cretica]
MKGGMGRECMLDSQTTPIHAVFRVLYRLSVTYRYDTVSLPPPDSIPILSPPPLLSLSSSPHSRVTSLSQNTLKPSAVKLLLRSGAVPVPERLKEPRWWFWKSDASMERREKKSVTNGGAFEKWWMMVLSLRFPEATCSLVLRHRRGLPVKGALRVTGCVNKTFPGSFYRLRRGVMVRMRRGESTLKVQWRDLVGIEGCLQRRLRILASLDSVYMFGDVRVRLVYLAAPLSLC